MKTEIERANETIEELKLQLFEANCIIDAIKEGAIDALVVNKSGLPSIYALESSDFTYRMLIEKSGEGAISISPGGLILYCNEYFSSMVGMPVNKIIGTYFNSYIDSVGKFQQLKTALQTGPSRGEIVLNVDGRKLPVYASLTDLNPQVAAIGIIITDLTEKRRQEDAMAAYRQKLENRIGELKRSKFSLEQFIHVIRNDIKEPLRKIIKYAGSLAENGKDHFDREEVRELKIINSAANRISTMLSDVSRYALNVHQPDTSEVDLNSVVKEVTEDIALLIEEHNVDISLKPLPLIKGSPLQMHLLFLNLFDNAIRSATNGSAAKIKITTDVEDCVDMRQPNKKYYRIDLQGGTSGANMLKAEEAAAAAHNNPLNSDNDQSGMSLAICKRIMENHSGRMEYGNVSGNGNGNLFRLYFPLPD
jgi:PAS domain S-box-containing protein